jgi:hypothetical protein
MNIDKTMKDLGHDTQHSCWDLNSAFVTINAIYFIYN